MKPWQMSYEDRLREYEAEKRMLYSLGLDYREYEMAIQRLAKKWRV